MHIRWRATSALVLVALLALCATAAFWTPTVRAQAATPTWAVTPAPTTPVPAGCAELTQNGGFEAGFAGWVPGASPLPAAVVIAPVLSGVAAAGIGSHPDALSDRNLNSYSSIRQTVAVPWGYARTIVSFWTYTWAESATGRDRQQFLLLGPGDVVWATPWRALDNAQAWEQHIFEVIGVEGQTFELYFGVVNDGQGGRTALFVDEVHLWSCASDAWPAAATQMQSGDVVPPVITALAATPQVQAVPVSPAETMPTLTTDEGLTGARGIETLATPSAQWTVVAIGTVLEPQVRAPQVGGRVVATPALETPALLVETPVNATALLNTGTLETPADTVSMTPQSAETSQPAETSPPASFLSNLAARWKNFTVRWPTNWPLVVIGIIVVAIIILLIVRARQDRIGTP